MSDIYKQGNTSKLREKPYLRNLYNLTKNSDYKYQRYLKIISSPQIRNIYSRIRTNSSRLSPNPYSEISDICQNCGVLNNFKHILLHCSNYNIERDKFKTQLLSAGYLSDPTSDDFYRLIMNLDLSGLSNQTKKSVTPIILSYVGALGRKCAIW